MPGRNQNGFKGQGRPRGLLVQKEKAILCPSSLLERHPTRGPKSKWGLRHCSEYLRIRLDLGLDPLVPSDHHNPVSTGDQLLADGIIHAFLAQ